MLSNEQLAAVRAIAGDNGIGAKARDRRSGGERRGEETEPAPTDAVTNKRRSGIERRQTLTGAEAIMDFESDFLDPVENEDTQGCEDDTPPAPPALKAPRPESAERRDAEWAEDNLRWDGDRPLRDIANVLRVLNRHPEFQGRYAYNKVMGKVLDRGAVMMVWQVDELSALLQERFLPEIDPETVQKALLICANRSNEKGRGS